MNDLFKYGLLAVGGWLLYEYFYGTPAVSTTPVSTANVPAVGVATTQPGISNQISYQDAVNGILNGTYDFTIGPWDAGTFIRINGIIYRLSNGQISVVDNSTINSNLKWLNAKNLTPSQLNQLGITFNSPTSVPIAPVAAQSQISSNIQTQLQQLADSYIVANPTAGGLNVDQWNYYLAQITGAQISGAQAEQLILALGESDATRGKLIPLSVYLTALSATGLGKLGMGMLNGLGMLRSVR